MLKEYMQLPRRGGNFKLQFRIFRTGQMLALLKVLRRKIKFFLNFCEFTFRACTKKIDYRNKRIEEKTCEKTHC